MQKKLDNHDFVNAVNFEFINSLKNNGSKFLLTFDRSYNEICISTTFFDFDTAERPRGVCVSKSVFVFVFQVLA